MSGLQFAGCDLTLGRFLRTTLAGADFRGITCADKADFSGADLVATVWGNAAGRCVAFREARLVKAHFDRCCWRDCDFSSVQGAGLIFDHGCCAHCRFREAQLASSQWLSADLCWSDFSHADLSGSHFSQVLLERTQFHAARLDGVVWESTDRSEALGTDAELLAAERWLPGS